ncbi:aldehyde dehydrogenase family protein, partial [Mesorhizobium sp. M4B.F.Ca.ET.190.01.1.1]|uniref:aldehyde dehydrogenase family protein n=1 Tax=Mesorhizobium sp. M4B.F.Ca.ET.190.01.1.1 TaxID=2563951 RepID=UPI001093520D
MIEKKKFYINGEWVSPLTARDLEVIDPSNEEPCAIISIGEAADTDVAVAAALDAFESWSRTTPETRIALVERLLDIYKARANEMAEAISTEMGAPINLALK